MSEHTLVGFNEEQMKIIQSYRLSERKSEDYIKTLEERNAELYKELESTQAAELATLKSDLADEQKAHDQIASICFAAGVETGDGTSVDAVKRLRARLAEAEEALKRIREFDSREYTDYARAVSMMTIAGEHLDKWHV